MVNRIGRQVRESWKQGIGKVRRFCLSTLRPRLVKAKVGRRKGECIRCGACCRLVFKCPALYHLSDGTAGCRYHQLRPMNCRVFPMDERDLAERDMVMPHHPCGFYFEGVDAPASRREAGS
ncbi:MAG: hypothetical protein ACYTGB_09305 [Planctomycetota bacterium]|jgi:hypothetical protein